MAYSQKWLDCEDNDKSIDLCSSEDDSEVILSKAECETFFREEVRAWLNEEGPKLIKEGLSLPEVKKVYYPSQKTLHTPYKPPYKKQKANIKDERK